MLLGNVNVFREDVDGMEDDFGAHFREEERAEALSAADFEHVFGLEEADFLENHGRLGGCRGTRAEGRSKRKRGVHAGALARLQNCVFALEGAVVVRFDVVLVERRMQGLGKVAHLIDLYQILSKGMKI